MEDNKRLAVNLVDKVYRTSWEGRDWLVVPTVMIKAGVLNGELVPADELAKYPGSWNGRPFTIGHPKDGEDMPISAAAPDVLEKFRAGYVFGAEYDEDGESVPAELWVDVVRTMKLAGGPELIRRIKSGDPVEVSTGYFRDRQEQGGEWQGKAYDGVARNLRPDHLAALLDTEGACSWKDGCGCPRVNEDASDGMLLTAPAEMVYNAGKKGPGKGWWGPPKGTHGSVQGGAGAFMQEITEDQWMDWAEQVNGWEGTRLSIAVGALEMLQGNPQNTAAYVIEQDGELKGIAAISLPGSESPGAQEHPDSFFLEYLATKERGFGYHVMHGLALNADRAEKGLAWHSVSDAQGFYEKIGFTAESEDRFGADFILDHWDVQDWLSEMSINQTKAERLREFARAEPGDGVFAIPKSKSQTVENVRYDGIDFKPPEGVRAAYRNGLERHEKGETGDGLEEVTVRQARKFADGQPTSPEWARKGNRWWGRNERFADEEPGTPAYAAAQLWGGRNWFARIVRQMDATDGEQNEAREVTANVLSKARTPTYDGTSGGDWSAPSLEGYERAYDGDAGEGGIASRPAAFRRWVASHSLLGDPDGATLREVAFFPVVGTDGKLSGAALRAVLGGRGAQAQIPAQARASAQATARRLLEDEFDMEQNEQTVGQRLVSALRAALGFNADADADREQQELDTMARSKSELVSELCDRLELNAEENGEGLNALSADVLRKILNAFPPPADEPDDEPDEEEPMAEEAQNEQPEASEEPDKEEPQANEQPCADVAANQAEIITALERRIAELEQRSEASEDVVRQYQEAQASERASLIQDIVGNELSPWSKADLEQMDVPQLQKAARALTPRNYAGQTGGRPTTNKKDRPVGFYERKRAEE